MVGQERQFGVGPSMRLVDVGYGMTGGSGGPDGRPSHGEILDAFSRTKDAISTGRESRHAAETARRQKYALMRYIIGASESDLPAGVQRYVVGPRSFDGSLMINNSQYSQYQVVILAATGSAMISFDAPRDALVLPATGVTEITQEAFDSDRTRLDMLVRSHARFVEAAPVDTYILNLEEMDSLHRRNLRTRQKNPGFFDEQVVMPLSIALRYADQLETIPTPIIARSDNDTNSISFLLKGVHRRDWLDRSSDNIVEGKRKPYARIPLVNLEQMALACETGKQTAQNKAGAYILQEVNKQGIS